MSRRVHVLRSLLQADPRRILIGLTAITAVIVSGAVTTGRATAQAGSVERVDTATPQETERAQAGGDPREQEIDVLLKQIESSPSDAELHFRLANTYHGLGYLHSALDHFKQATRLDSTAFQAWVNRGVVLRELGRHDEARESLERALEIEPDDPLARVNLGDLFLAQNLYQAAVDEYRLALEHDPRCASAYFSLALAFAETGMYREAGRAWRRCAELVGEDRGEDHELFKRARDNAGLMEKIVADAQAELKKLESIEKELEEEKGQSD